ncbi:type II toxin-antitoxin system Phd/YefM family antitoxin [Candidatus Poribacteria bacterium]|nr:type II toxin-antitoxin system Phd/YefM family antitoxin [Candidatus Poribacteria bacterium]
MITKTVTIHEAQTQISELLTFALEGNEVIIADDNKPLVRLAPISSTKKKHKKKRVAGLHEGKGWVSEDFDDPLPDDFWTDSK